MAHRVWASQVVLVVKNPPANAGDARDTGSISGSGRHPLEEGIATHSSILAWKILYRVTRLAKVHGATKHRT